MFRRHRVAVLTIFTAILLFGPLQLADGAPRKTGVQKETAAKSDSGAKGQEAEPSKSGRNKPPAKDSFWDRFVNLVKPERAPRRREPEVTNDEQIVFNIGGATGARARVEAVVNEEAVSVWTLDEELVEPTPEGTSPAPEKTKKDSKESGPAPVEVKGTTSKVEGDLRAVALGAMKSNLFELAPEAVVTEKALSPEDKAYTYRVSIDEFREFRNKAGDFICAIDARMEVLKPDGTPAQPAEEFQFPEGRKNRLTEDDFKQLIARNEVVVDVLDSLDEVASNANADETGMVISFFAKLGKKWQERRLEQRKLSLTSKDTGIKTYQMQEALIRKAVDELMYYPVVPGGSDALKAPYKYKDVAKSQLEGKHFQEAGDYEEALKLWSAVEAPTPELRYNLGVLHLRRASLNLKDRLPDALLDLEKAKSHFASLHEKYKKEGDLLTLPTRVLKELGTAGLIVAGDTATVAPKAAPPAVEKPFDKWALLIGVNDFEDAAYNPLKGPSNDIKDFRAALLRAGFPANNILTLENRDVSTGNLRKKFGELAQRVGPGSLVVVHVATHGTAGKSGRDGYIVCHDTKPDQLYATAYQVNEFRAMTAALPCNQKILIQDTCHAAASKNVVFPSVPPLMVVFSSADANQLALEKNNKGLFMQHFAAEVSNKRGRIAMPDLAAAVQAKVSKAAAGLGSAQNPRVEYGPNGELVKLNY